MIPASEIWKPVVGYEGYYEVSDFGRVRSVDRIIKNHHLKGKIVPFSLDRYGYPVVHLSKENVQKHRTIHSLVAKAFIPNPENKKEVNHRFGIKTDNRVSELEWASSSENQIHAFKNGLQIPKKGENHYAVKLSDKQVVEIFNSKLKGVELSKIYGVATETISGIKTGRKRSGLTGKSYIKKYIRNVYD